MCHYQTPAHARVSPVPGSRSGPDLTQGDPGCAYRGPVPLAEVRFNWYILGCIIFLHHMAPLERPTWWGPALFTVWLGNVVWAPRLHTIVRATPDSGY
jgi:hypothetical protein